MPLLLAKYSETVSVTVRVPAKVNAYLGVGPRQADGFHSLATIFQSLGVYDEVTVAAAGELSITAAGTWADRIPTDETNLAWQAAVLMGDRCQRAPLVSITIDKSIPVAAGLAGGSADAAAVLVACNELWGAELDRGELDSLASQLGSDVPFMLHGGCALGSGRGDHLTPAMTRGTFHWVLATFSDGLSTPAVYRRFDELRPDAEDPAVPSELMQALARGDAEALGLALHNDLQQAAVALRPALGRVLSFGIDHGALGALVSGSGPTCAFLVRHEAAAIDLVVDLMGSGLVDGAMHTHGPVHGARVV